MLLVFDIDGTLTDTTGVDDRCFFQVFRELFGVEPGAPDWSTFQNVTDLGLLHELHERVAGRPLDPQMIQPFHDRLCALLEMEIRPGHCTPVPGAMELVAFCRAQPLPIAFATGSWERCGRTKLTCAGIPWKGSPLVGCDRSITRKGIVEQALAQARAQHPSAISGPIVAFGDGVWDLRCAQELGLRFIGVDMAGNGHLAKASAELVVSDLRDQARLFTHISGPGAGVRIVEADPSLFHHMKSLNVEWLEEHFVVEPRDEMQLSDPQGQVIDRGGHIWFAEFAGVVVGTVTLMYVDDQTFELSKMAVTRGFHGRGIGRALMEHVVGAARRMGATGLVLYSNTRLRAAIALYRKYGFIDVPLDTTQYARANIKMRLQFA